MATTRAWLDPKEHSVEGHTKQCILTFNNSIIWGPTSCHENTVQLRDALVKADPRFNIILMDKPPTTEGHTAYISVSAHGTVYLNRLNTHQNMAGLCEAIHNAQQ
ncbi:putative nuclear RNA binding protein [Rosellinia necatrix]|uniref:Putative nuclear RNA binding protein n=1 Tax=Rosellinia necatrix TaxID=77044 RepID=A0A1S7UI42_ROSNE|nr:putative nuclear RNA binding protein [Rosellinia necatrix]